MRGRRASRVIAFAACGGAISALAAGCGEARQDAREEASHYTVQVVRARFPHKQALARGSVLEIAVRNGGSRTVPDVAVTLDSLSYVERYPNLADPHRPVWIVSSGPGAIAKRPVETVQLDPPGSGQTAYVNTWALGALAPGHTRVFTWKLMPVKAGTHTVRYIVAAGLSGKARAMLSGGARPTGALTADIASRPPRTHVDAETGEVVPGIPPTSATPVGAVP